MSATMIQPHQNIAVAIIHGTLFMMQHGLPHLLHLLTPPPPRPGWAG